MARRRIGVADIKAVLVAWEAGQSVSAIARMLGYTRPTVRKYIEAAQRHLGLPAVPGRQQQRGARPVGQRRRSDLEWEAIAQTVQARLARHRPAGAAAAEVTQHHAYLEQQVGQVALSVLHQRLRDERGLQASWGTVYRYARAHWPERLRCGGVPAPVTIRLADPPPGEEAQVDFFYVGRWTDPGTGHTFRLSAFLMTLSASRHLFLYPVVREDEQTWLEAHVAAFTFFGGVPRRLVPDNLTAAIVKADRYDPRLNRAYSELTRYYGCLVDPARVAHPKDKPRVERTVAYARASFFRGQTFSGLDQMRREAVQWARAVAGQRVHGTTGERPLVVFEAREQAALLPLPPAPWELARWLRATVHADCHLNAGGARYSVPYRSVGRTLDVRLGQRTVAIYDGAELLTTHLRQARGHATRLEHYPEDAQAFVRATPAVCQARAAQVGPATVAVVEPLLASHTLHQLREVQALLRLVELYSASRLEVACARALAVGDARLRTVRGLLERGLERGLDRLDALAPEPEPLATGAGLAGAFLRGPGAFAADRAESKAAEEVPTWQVW